MLGDVKPKSLSFRENRKSHIISTWSVISVVQGSLLKDEKPKNPKRAMCFLKSFFVFI